VGPSTRAISRDAVLIYPPFISYFAGPPLGIAALSAALERRGYRCDAWDVNAEFIHHLAEGRNGLADLSSRLERRLSALYSGPALDYHAQQETLTLINALDTQAPVVRHLLAGEPALEDRRIVGDHDKDLAFILLLELAALDALSASRAPYRESYNAELPPAEMVRLAREESFGAWGQYARDVLVPRLLDSRPRLVGFSLMDVTQLLPMLSLAHLVKTAMPETFVVAGGSYVSAIKDKLPSLAACHGLIDAFFCFEGETGLTGLLDDLAHDRPVGPDVSNCAVWNRVGYEWRERSVVEDLERLPIPNFDSMNLEVYGRPRALVPLPLITSKGCVYGKCRYCTYVYQEAVNREVPVDRVLTTISTLQRRHGVRTFSLKDSLITATRARGLAEGFRRGGLDIVWNFQSKIGRGFNRELVTLLDEAGCRTIEFGVETPNARLQKLIQKPAPVEMIETVLGAFAGSRITVIFNMIYGFPSETRDEAEQALEWVSALPGRHPDVRFASVNHMLNLSRNAAFHTAAPAYGIDVVGEWPFAADAEWITPPWHAAFRRKIARVLHHADAAMTGKVFAILARERHRRLGNRYSLRVLEARLAEAEERIERIRIEKRILRAQAAQEYARLTAPLTTELLAPGRQGAVSDDARAATRTAG
jgi:hypothetical protein